MLFTPFGYWSHGGGGSRKGLVHNVLMRFSLRIAEKSKFSKLTFLVS